MIERRFTYANTAGLILRRTLVELERSHILKMLAEFPQLVDGWREQKKRLELPNGSVLFFGSAPSPLDVKDYCSDEYADILIDEGQEFTQDEIERLGGSNRCTTNQEITPKMVIGFMPGRGDAGVPPKGLAYLKRVFVEGTYTEEERRFCGPDKRWAFVQAFSWDNIEWARKELTRDGVGRGEHKFGDPHCPCQDCEFYSWSHEQRRQYFVERTEYGEILNALTDKNLRDAWLDGKWETFEGQYFTQFSCQRHVLPSREVQAIIQPWWKYWISGDWGYGHPHAIHFHAMNEHGHVFTFAELWGREVNETALAQNINQAAIGRKFSSFVFSYDAGELSTRSTPKFPKSIGQMISDALAPGIPKPHPADSRPGSRIAGARLMSQLLDANQWTISDSCTHLIKCLPSLLHSPKNTEDVLKVDFPENGIGDDSYDSARYGLQFMLGAPFKPGAVRLEERIQGVREQFLKRSHAVQPPKPGTNWFAQFGGTSAKSKK
jgi:hypothetical protein